MADDKIIDFQTAKAPHVHARRDKQVDEMRQAFANYLEEGKSPADRETRQQRRKKDRDRNKKKR